MRKFYFFGAILLGLCFIIQNANAQLEVQTSGDVKIFKNAAIGTNPNTNTCLIIVDTITNSNTRSCGVKSEIDVLPANTTSSYAISGAATLEENSNPSLAYSLAGVYGFGKKHYTSTTAFSVGVAGITYYYGGIGVYGGIGSGGIPASMSGGNTNYAGYFDGTVKVNGTLITPVSATISDSQLNENVQRVSSSLANNIQLLTPVSYTLKQDTLWQYDKDAKELQGLHYGLMAEDVQKIFPELVYERQGNLAINYTELIPLLIMKIQELSTEVDKLKVQVKNNK